MAKLSYFCLTLKNPIDYDDFHLQKISYRLVAVVFQEGGRNVSTSRILQNRDLHWKLPQNLTKINKRANTRTNQITTNAAMYVGVCVNACMYVKMMTFSMLTFYTLSHYFTVFAHENLVFYLTTKTNFGVLTLIVLKYTEFFAD